MAECTEGAAGTLVTDRGGSELGATRLRIDKNFRPRPHIFTSPVHRPAQLRQDIITKSTSPHYGKATDIQRREEAEEEEASR